jgi:hypothetical protein
MKAGNLLQKTIWPQNEVLTTQLLMLLALFTLVIGCSRVHGQVYRFQMECSPSFQCSF